MVSNFQTKHVILQKSEGEGDGSQKQSDEVHKPQRNAGSNNNSSLQLSLTPLREKIGLNASERTTYFCANITAEALDSDEDRAPVDVMVALDVSGSMSGNKLELCKETLELLTRELGPEDRFGLVTFGSRCRVHIAPKKLTKSAKEAAIMTIKSIRSGGGTNMSGGIELAAKELRNVVDPHEVRAIFLLTDGHANQGISDMRGITRLAKECLTPPLESREREIAIHCFGYGRDHNVDMLQGISGVTEGGSYYFVDNKLDVSSAFGDALGGILSMVAQKTVMHIRVPAQAAKNGVHIIQVKHREAKKLSDGSFKISTGDFYAEESRDVIIEVSLAVNSNSSSELPIPHLLAWCEYDDTVNKRHMLSDETLGYIFRPDGSKEISEENPKVLIQIFRVRITEVITEAERLACAGDFEAANKKIMTSIADLYFDTQGKDSVKNDPLFGQLITELKQIKDGLTSKATYESHGHKFMAQRKTQHMQQRSMASTTIETNVYRNASKLRRATAMSCASRLTNFRDSFN